MTDEALDFIIMVIEFYMHLDKFYRFVYVHKKEAFFSFHFWGSISI
jgi:hypothetical protein